MPFKNPHPLYSVWQSMRDRCRNPKATAWKDYGGRGITIDPRWDYFANFVADMGDRPEGFVLDRIDNDSGYGPQNCRWATHRQSQDNRRITIKYEIEGKTYLLSQLRRRSGLKADTIKARIAKGYKTLAEILDFRRDVFKPGLEAGIIASAHARKARTHCKNGHPWNDENTRYAALQRECRACAREKAARQRLRKKGGH